MGIRRVPLQEGLRGAAAEGAWLTLWPEAEHYLCRVLRLGEGAEVELFDGAGQRCRALLSRRDGLLGLACGSWREGPQVSYGDVLAASLLKGERWEWLIEKAAELGAEALWPLRADRSVVRVPEGKVSERVTRWQRIAESAARQCERDDVMEVLPPMSLEDAWRLAGCRARWVADEEEGSRPWPPIPLGEGVVGFLGPEGGWSARERRWLEQVGATRIGLGPSVLRAETAGCALLAGLRLWRAQILG